jgi:anti-sigma regulatory factor (Ser/Thr protein kinase)
VTIHDAAAGVRRIAELPDPTSRDVFHELLPVSGAPRYARDVVTEACLRWDLPELVGSAALIISELVSNAVDHAHTTMTVEVSHRGSDLYLAVHDGSGAPPVPRASDGKDLASRGRGLMLVAATATAWGYRTEDGGKTVWATLALRP